MTAPGEHQRRSVLILERNAAGRYVANCTGSMVSDRHVLTAGHCADVSAIQLVPSAYRAAGSSTIIRPYGTCTVRSRRYDNGGGQWTPTNDYALLTIDTCTRGSKNPTGSRLVGRLTGAWCVKATENREWDDTVFNEGETLYTASYPLDKGDGNMWAAKHKTIDNFGNTNGFASGQLAGGASGGPLVGPAGDGNCVWAVVIRTLDPEMSGTGRTGGITALRMTASVQRDLSAWKSQMP